MRDEVPFFRTILFDVIAEEGVFFWLPPLSLLHLLIITILMVMVVHGVIRSAAGATKIQEIIHLSVPLKFLIFPPTFLSIRIEN